MHKGTILLIKADDEIQARSGAESFMEPYGNDVVWDWYCIGGRWTGVLSGYDPNKDDANSKPCWLCDATGLRNDVVGIQARAENPDYTCNGCSGTGSMPKHPSEWIDKGNVMPLKECIEIVEKWQQNYIEDGKKEVERASEWLDGTRGTDDYNMYGYVLGCAAKILQQIFSFEANIYNAEACNFSIPDDKGGWYAIMVDMHT